MDEVRLSPEEKLTRGRVSPVDKWKPEVIDDPTEQEALAKLEPRARLIAYRAILAARGRRQT